MPRHAFLLSFNISMQYARILLQILHKKIEELCCIKLPTSRTITKIIIKIDFVILLPKPNMPPYLATFIKALLLGK